MKKLFLILLILPLFILSCSNDDSDPTVDLLDGGTFDLILSGELNVTLSGEASFLHGKYNDYEGIGSASTLTINFINEDEDFIFTCGISLFDDATGVKPGSYPVAIEAAGGDPTVILGTFTENGSLLGTTGSVTISEVKDFTVKGSIDATLGNGIDNTRDTTIKGSFTAKGITETQ